MTVSSEKDNAFSIMLKWRYEDSGLKLVQLKKKIGQLKDKLNKEQDSMKKIKDNYEKLLNCNGSDGSKLIELWGLAVP